MVHWRQCSLMGKFCDFVARKRPVATGRSGSTPGIDRIGQLLACNGFGEHVSIDDHSRRARCGRQYCYPAYRDSSEKIGL